MDEAHIQASFRALDQPVWRDLRSHRLCVIPLADMDEAIRLPFGLVMSGDSAGNFLSSYAGVKLMAGSPRTVAQVTEAVASFHQSLGVPPADSAPAMSRVLEFHPTYGLGPQSEQLHDTLVEFLGETPQVSAISLASGIVVGDVEIDGEEIERDWAELQLQVHFLLRHAAFAQLARDLSWGSDARRAAAFRAALADDDPLIARFALHMWEAGWVAGARFERFPQELLARWPHAVLSGAAVERVFEGLPAEQAIHDIQEIARTDQGSHAASLALRSVRPVLRQAAMAAILERLPAGGLEAAHMPEAKNWTEAERELFFERLVDRIREELHRGDGRRAVRMAQQALYRTSFRVSLISRHGRAHSRLRELAATLFLDDVYGDQFRRGSAGFAAFAGAEELLRDSRPEVRRMACAYLIENFFDAREDLLLPLAGDPYTAEFQKPATEE